MRAIARNGALVLATQDGEKPTQRRGRVADRDQISRAGHDQRAIPPTLTLAKSELLNRSLRATSQPFLIVLNKRLEKIPLRQYMSHIFARISIKRVT